MTGQHEPLWKPEVKSDTPHAAPVMMPLCRIKKWNVLLTTNIYQDFFIENILLAISVKQIIKHGQFVVIKWASIKLKILYSGEGPYNVNIC